MLSRRALSEEEIRTRLIRKGFDPAESERALGRLRELGLADDRTLCGRLARGYRRDRRWGPRRIAGKLASRKFSRELIEEALRAIRPEEEFAAALEALRRRFREGIPPGRGGAAKVYRFLAARGFPPDTCRRAIRAETGGIDDDAGGDG